jgi:hypothetical protein
MSIDPNDDCTFWYTNMYYVNPTDGTNGNWSTRIGSFKFPSCGQSQPTTGTPSVVSATIPAAGTGNSGAFTFQFSDTAGFGNIQVADVLINSALDGRHGCYIAFIPGPAGTGTVSLVDDAGDAGGPYQNLQLPGSSSVSNSQCSIAGAGSSVTSSGNTLTVTLNITFNAPFAGYRVFYASVGDKSGANSGWQAMGTWLAPGLTFVGPGVGGVSPARGPSQNSPATYTFTFTDTLGKADIAVANILVNTAVDGRHACYLAFVPSSTGGVLNLVDDAGDGGGPFQVVVLPGSGSISNSQCSVSGSVSSGANSITLSLNIAFNHSFTGNQIIYMATRSNTATSNWQAVGSVSVP